MIYSTFCTLSLVNMTRRYLMEDEKITFLCPLLPGDLK
jgi:hypothetical protein